MASIFTFDPDPPRVASPWLTPTDTPKPSTPQPRDSNGSSSVSPFSAKLADYGVTRLEAEPEEGPTEYKLHLLLRPRRNYTSSSTASPTSTTHRIEDQSTKKATPTEPGPILAPSSQSRQNRLEHLTTQLLWRLQQSSPYHASSTSDLVIPKLPDSAASLPSPSRPGKLVAGLEESRGALYEIGVSDDGTFVGLTKDEMDESLTNLRAMAASLGCTVEVVRMVVVGECEWNEPVAEESSLNHVRHEQWRPRTNKVNSANIEGLRHKAQLWVAEVLVIPDLSSQRLGRPLYPTRSPQHESLPSTKFSPTDAEPFEPRQATEQLRVTLTGPTTSGKSSLLGTLSTATLDNGRGKSRLSLLKHRHEIVSGVTSSVTQELMGYNGAEVVNYASGNVTSWTDIHASAEKGRLVFFSDSAGHPRYRRTTVRGLVGWAPHWTLLCIAADDGENAPLGAGGTASAQEILGTAGAGIDLAKAHLELCLKLDKPLAIVITKLDIASKTSLRQTLTKILSAIKSAGRTPLIIPPSQAKTIIGSDLTIIPEHEEQTVRAVLDKVTANGNFTSAVPIIMTSSAKGIGISSMHALLRNLPIPSPPTAQDFIGPVLNPEQPACLYHIEDVFGLPASIESLAPGSKIPADKGVVVAGHLRFGSLSVGNIVVIGPFPTEAEEGDPPPKVLESRSPNNIGSSLSHSPATELSQAASRSAASASVTKGEWHLAHVVSIRNLRLPVRTLEPGQVGTVGVVFDIPEDEDSNGPFERQQPTAPRIRKGLVMAIPSRHMIQTGHTMQAASGFTASFEDGDINSVIPGSVVVVYVASIRASARVLKLSPHTTANTINPPTEELGVFGLDDTDEREHEHREGETNEGPLIFGRDGITDVKMELLTNREWIELGETVLVMPGGGQGLYYGSERGEKGVAGLDGFVGRVVEVVD